MLHEPKQSRSRRTLERIVASARHLMAEEGVEAVGITQIVREARSSVGSFYARFDGKEDLVRYLHTRLWEEAADRWKGAGEAWNSEDALEVRVENLVTLLETTLKPDFGLRSALTHEMGADGSSARRVFDSRVAGDGLLLMDRGSNLRHPAPEEAVRTGIRVALSTLRDHLGDEAPSWPDTNQDESKSEALVIELSRVLRGYWGVGRAVQIEDTPDQRIEYFDIWN